MKTVAMVLYDDVLALDVSGPMEVFSMANRYLPPERHYRLLTVAARPESVRASSGLRMSADLPLEALLAGVDLLLVPGGPGAYNGNNEALNAWLPAAARAAKRYGAVCTGAFLLGAAGLLDGYRCTTHWNYLERLARLYPRTQVQAERIYVIDRNLITSGGVTAGIDMALAVVAEDHGKDVALEVAKVLLVVLKRQGGQTPFGPLLVSVVRDGSLIARAQAFVVDHIDEPLTVNRLAEQVAMSPRNFARAFQRETGMTPMQYVQSARIDHARKLLESSDLPLKQVACRSGFGSPRHMRTVFGERIGMTPSQYREQFDFA
ncbi:transcriptional regulator GlxA family with amidase domain [Pseudomonas nitritireducens]|uniref:Transcriptional regulator GlxA family with amidase domain n=1 Tax=Pseudomonas nitroreducens TaxID=46680 RepID=A0A7W7P4X6_PSENT|nr:GlxA family transcriptional regulator [Pseudomonas nitritireducens]MBB4866722.1 transcriptional regulator GlxA family with amidase domain [Pseudomonas nitritireducens]